MKKLFLAFLLAILPAAAQAQSLTPGCSNPPPSYGVVWTPGQWKTCLSSFQAFLGYTPLNVAGGFMSGELFLQPSSTTNPPLNFPPGSAPSAPSNGDTWFTSAGMFYRAGGVTVGPLIGGSGGGGLTVGSTAISGGSSGNALYDNAGVLGERTVSGSGSVVLNSGPTIAAAALNSATINSPTLTGSNFVALSMLNQAGANTVLGNFTGSTANVAASSMPSCPDSSGNHLNYVNGTGIICGTSLPFSTPVPVASGGTGASTLTGLVKGNGTSPMTAATAGTDYCAPGTSCTTTALYTFSGTPTNLAAALVNAAENGTTSATAATGTINFDACTQAVLYYTTNASANWTENIRCNSGNTLNSVMSTGQWITVVHAVTQGATPFYNNVYQIDGNGVTPKWQGGVAPGGGNASGVDVYTYTIVKTGSAAFTVFASQVQFK